MVEIDCVIYRAMTSSAALRGRNHIRDILFWPQP